MHERSDLPVHDVPLALRLGSQIADFAVGPADEALLRKAVTCLYDFAGCALESCDKATTRQALVVAPRLDPAGVDAATIIGRDHASSLTDAAFVNGTMGHGLVREDMHSASISHLGVAVLPALLALTAHRRVAGRDLFAAIVAGYEVGARIGGALMDPAMARVFRPTGITGPLAAAAAGCRLLGLDASATASALALAANTTGGFNQWGHTGGSEMYFHPGFAARSGVSAVLLAEAGAFASPSALDGEAGLFASHGKRAAARAVSLFDGGHEILNVYHKPVPACNFAQTPAQAAMRVARRDGFPEAGQIESITIRVPRAGAVYPGCDFTGPFDHVLQAKMSIQYNVAAALLQGDITEASFDRLDDPRLARLLAVSTLEIDTAMTDAYPARQGGAVDVVTTGGKRIGERLVDVVHASADEVHARFRSAARACLGEQAAARADALIARFVDEEDCSRIAAALGKRAA